MFAGFETGCSVGLNSCLGLNWKILAFQLMHGGWHLNGLCRAIGGDEDVIRELSLLKKIHFFEISEIPVVANFMRRRVVTAISWRDCCEILHQPPPPDRKRKKPSVLRNISDDGTRISRMPTGFSTPPKPAQDDLLMTYIVCVGAPLLGNELGPLEPTQTP